MFYSPELSKLTLIEYIPLYMYSPMYVYVIGFENSVINISL